MSECVHAAIPLRLTEVTTLKAKLLNRQRGEEAPAAERCDVKLSTTERWTHSVAIDKVNTTRVITLRMTRRDSRAATRNRRSDPTASATCFLQHERAEGRKTAQPNTEPTATRSSERTGAPQATSTSERHPKVQSGTRVVQQRIHRNICTSVHLTSQE